MPDKVEEIVIELSIDELEDALAQAEEEVQQLNENAKKTISFVKKETRLTFSKVVQIAKTAWYVIDNLVQSTGGSIATELRLAINAAFSTISILTPIVAAEMVTPGMQIQAALGAVQLGAASMAIAQAQANQDQMNSMFDTMHALRGMDTLIGFMEFL